MNFSVKQKKQIKKIQKLILANVIACESDVRPSIISRFKEVKYRFLTEQELADEKLATTVAAFFDELTDEICFKPNFSDNKIFEHILLHEMIHAHSYKNGYSGLNYVDKRAIDEKNFVMEKRNQMIDESATEFYASMFDGSSPMSYIMFVPIYAHLSDVCGYEKLMTLYFSNNHEKFVQTIVDTYHLKDDYLPKKMFMQMDQSFNLQTGQQNLFALKEAYKTLLQMNIEKTCHELGRKLTNKELVSKIDCSKIIGLNNIQNPNAIKFLKYVQNSMENYLKNYSNDMPKTDLDKVAKTVDEFVFHRLNATKNVDYNAYKEFFMENLCDVLLYLDQNQIYSFENYFMNYDLAINEVLMFVQDKNRHIDLSHLSKNDRHCAINMIANNCKHHILNKNEQLEISDYASEIETEKNMNLEL